MWCLGPFETIQTQPTFQSSKGEWLLQEQERIVKLAVGAHTVTEFANAMGLGHMDQDMFLAAVRSYAVRKELVADYAGKRFVPGGAAEADVANAGAETSRPPSPAMQGLSAQEVAEVVQMLAATKLENERLRAAAIPRLTRQQLEYLIAESLPYQWMQTLAVAQKAYSATDANWDRQGHMDSGTRGAKEQKKRKNLAHAHPARDGGANARNHGGAHRQSGQSARWTSHCQSPTGGGGRSDTRADNLDIGRDSARKRRSRARCISRTSRPRYPTWGIRRYSPVIRGGHLI